MANENEITSAEDQALADEWAAALEETGAAGQADIDALLGGDTGFFQGRSPLIGQRLVLCRGDLVFVSHGFLDRHSIR